MEYPCTTSSAGKAPTAGERRALAERNSAIFDSLSFIHSAPRTRNRNRSLSKLRVKLQRRRTDWILLVSLELFRVLSPQAARCLPAAPLRSRERCPSACRLRPCTSFRFSEGPPERR